MSKIVIIDKNGDASEVLLKNKDEIYKKCGLRKTDFFDNKHRWSLKYDSKHINLELYAKDNGRCNNINKFELPPPCDKSLYYGSMAIVLSFNDKIEDLTVDLWNKLYEKLYGGFEDITNTKDDDENEVDELKDIPKSEKTKNGYLKDGFVVDNESEETGSDEISD